MTLTTDHDCTIPSELQIKDDIKREVAIYNSTRENVMKGMQFLVQSGVPISRPDDFFAEMLKSDQHMSNVKGRLLKQQVKIKTFEEKKQRAENKKFHKAIKEFKMKAKHTEKRENLEQISKLKKRIKERGDDMEDADFDKIMLGNKGASSRRRGGQKNSVIDSVKEGVKKRTQQKNNFKKGKGKKRPGKNVRSKGGKGGKRR